MKKIALLVLVTLFVSVVGCPLFVSAETFSIPASGNAVIAGNSYSGSNKTYSPISNSGYVGIQWPSINDWASYDINVEEDGAYAIKFYISAPTANATIGISRIMGSNEYSLGKMTRLGTGGWANYVETDPVRFNCPKGLQKLKLTNLSGGMFLIYFTIEKVGEFGSVPVSFEAENFTASNKTAASLGAASGGKIMVLNSGNSDWVQYDVNIDVAGSYQLIFGYSSVVSPGITIYVNDMITPKASVKLAQTGATWGGTFATQIVGQFNLHKGTNTIKAVHNQTGGNGIYLDYFTLARLSDYMYKVEAETFSGSDKTVTTLGAASGGALMALNHSNYVEYSANLDVSGSYRLTMVYGTTVSPKVSVFVNGLISKSNIALAPTAGFVDFKPQAVVTCNLSEGLSIIKIVEEKTGGNGMYFDYFTLERVGDPVPYAVPGYTVGAEQYALGSAGINTIGANGGYCVQLLAGEWLKYNLNIDKTGYYNIKFTAAGSTANNEITVSSNVGGNCVSTVNCAGNGEYSMVNVGDVFLKQGQNEIIIEFTGSTGEIDVDYFTLYAPIVNLYEQEMIAGNEITSVVSDTMIAKAELNGLFSGKEVSYAFAIYKDNQLAEIRYETKTVTDLTVLSASVENFVKETGAQYCAKIFIWDNLTGNYYTYE